MSPPSPPSRSQPLHPRQPRSTPPSLCSSECQRCSTSSCEVSTADDGLLTVRAQPTLPLCFPSPRPSLPAATPSHLVIPLSPSRPLSPSFSDTIQAASSQGILDCLQLLLEASADVDCRDHEGSTPLHWGLQAPSERGGGGVMGR